MIRTVSAHTTAIEAHIVRCRLEYEGIPAFVMFEHHIWAMWTRSLTLGGVRVQVPASYYDAAVAIVKNIMAGSYASELDEANVSPVDSTCPRCKSANVANVNWPWKTALVVFIVFILPIPYTTHMMRCDACTHRWIASEQRAYPLYVIAVVLVIYAMLIFTLCEAWCHWCRLHCENPYVCMP